MIVYVESNFVLELAYMQEEHESCDEIMNMAEAGRIQVVLPAFSISEPYDTFVRRANERKATLRSLDKEVRQLRRSAPYARIEEQSTTTATLLAGSIDEEKRRLDASLRRILACAETIAVDSEVLDSAINGAAS